MNRTTSSASSRWAALVLIAGMLALTGCGRKGGLDLPPNAQVPPTAAAGGSGEAEAAAKGTLFDPSYGNDKPPVAAAGSSRRSFVLDPLLGN